jgi:hypothetical protein
MQNLKQEIENGRRQNKTKNLAMVLGSASLGVLAAFLFDPISGSRRRAFLRDKGVSLKNSALHRVGKISRDLRNRMRGLESRTARIAKHDEADDQTLIARLRSQFGKKVTHPKSIEIEAREGTVTLRGAILANEVDALIRCAKKVRGVKKVVNGLDPYPTESQLPSLHKKGKPTVESGVIL